MQKYKSDLDYPKGTKYLYIVTFEDRNIKYYYVGIQYGKNSNPKNLGLKYFTSSNRVKNLIKKFDLSKFKFEVRLVFDSDFSNEKLIDIEFKYIKYLKKIYPTTCLNQLKKGTDNSQLNLRGAANPSYGSTRSKGLILIHNPNNQFQKRVYKDEIQTYLDMGWIKGANKLTKKSASERAKRNYKEGIWISPSINKDIALKISKNKKDGFKEGILVPPCKGKFGKDHPNFGMKQTDHQKRIAKETMQKEWIVINPEGQQFNIVNLRQFCLEYKLDQGNMVKVSQGKLGGYKKWKCIKL